jgi:hypothetical protein
VLPRVWSLEFGRSRALYASMLRRLRVSGISSFCAAVQPDRDNFPIHLCQKKKEKL